MVDLSKLPEKAVIAFVVVMGLLTAALFGTSYFSNGPFTIYGKEFGFGSNELKEKTAEFEDFRNQSSKAFAELQRQLAEAKTENVKLKEEKGALIAQLQERARQDAAMWFPIDDVEFLENGTFNTLGGKQGKGRWSNSDSELALQLIRIASPEVVLETNLPPPGNKIRLQKGAPGILVHMNKWDYQLSLQGIGSYPNSTTIRVERRPK